MLGENTTDPDHFSFHCPILVADISTVLLSRLPAKPIFDLDVNVMTMMTVFPVCMVALHPSC